MGAGYVGLTTGICLASVGHKIIIYEVDETKIQKLEEGKLPFFEPGLDQLLDKVISSENLRLSNSVKELVLNSDGCFVCVGTPSCPNKSIDLSQIT
ncbi:MAG: UDP-glucose 6-dehydrogenase, partial [Patescibacteria group bacterium]|nr:UDP-glucose 6-dehydrogenase [Patescibacteria group bacterium]